jgi:hypothetical protein
MRRLMLTIVQTIGTTAAFAQLPPEPSCSTRCRPAAMWDTAPALSVGITRQLFTASPATALRSDDQPTPEREADHHPQLSRRLGPQAAVRDSASLASLLWRHQSITPAPIGSAQSATPPSRPTPQHPWPHRGGTARIAGSQRGSAPQAVMMPQALLSPHAPRPTDHRTHARRQLVPSTGQILLQP